MVAKRESTWSTSTFEEVRMRATGMKRRRRHCGCRTPDAISPFLSLVILVAKSGLRRRFKAANIAMANLGILWFGYTNAKRVDD